MLTNEKNEFLPFIALRNKYSEKVVLVINDKRSTSVKVPDALGYLPLHVEHLFANLPMRWCCVLSRVTPRQRFRPHTQKGRADPISRLLQLHFKPNAPEKSSRLLWVPRQTN